MKGDFSRLTFRPERQYSAVLFQQGRVQLDADANEQAMIGLYQLRSLAADVIGRHGGPADGFQIAYVAESANQPASLAITRGRYYVDGVLADSTAPPALTPVGANPPQATDLTYWNQPFAYRDQNTDQLPGDFPFLVYLKVFEDLVTAVADPALREPALGPLQPDTTARTRVVWQVLPLTLPLDDGQDPVAAFDDWVAARQGEGGLLAARTRQPSTDEDPCVIPPDSAYRGPENQLYRVEIHDGGTADSATFVWSRDNGSVVFPVVSLAGDWVTLSSLGRDGKLALEVGDWTELVDDAYAARGVPAALSQVVELDLPGSRVRIDPAPAGRSPALHPLLRRWDQRGSAGGAVPVTEGAWLDLEDGVQVWFQPDGTYVSGDYWLLPARTLTADVEWPTDDTGTPLLVPPAGPRIRYAPLAWITGARDVRSLRRTFTALAQ